MMLQGVEGNLGHYECCGRMKAPISVSTKYEIDGVLMMAEVPSEQSSCLLLKVYTAVGALGYTEVLQDAVSKLVRITIETIPS